MMMEDEGPPGFVKVVLGKDWGESKTGDVVWVDPERKKWLQENGFEALPVISDAAKPTATTTPWIDIQGPMKLATVELATPPIIPSLTMKENDPHG
jgi:hypothetical protein